MADKKSEQPTKEHRLSLFLKKKGKVDTSERFQKVKDEEVEVAGC